MNTILPGIPHLQDFTVAQIELWLLALLRVSVMTFLLPIVMTDDVPTQFKAALAFFLSLLVFPTLPGGVIIVPDNPADLFALALRELYVGAVMGFAATFVFAGLRIAGAWIDQEVGFSMVHLLNPLAQEEDTALANLLFIIFVLLLLATGGHIFWIQAIGESFRTIPLAGAHFQSGPVMNAFLNLTRLSFLFGLQASAPILTSLFLSSVALAIVSRIMPQMNVWLVGTPMKMMLGFIMVWSALPTMWQLFFRHQEAIASHAAALMHIMGKP